MDIQSLDARLRDVEQDQAEARGKLDTLLSEVIKVRDYIDSVQKAAGRLEQVDKLEAAVLAAHQRLDKLSTSYEKLKWTQEYCQKDKVDNAQLLKDINTKLQTLEGDVKAVKTNVASHALSEDSTKSFLRSRLEKIVDAGLIVIAVALGWTIVSYYADQLPNKDLDKANQQISELKQQVDELTKHDLGAKNGTNVPATTK